MFQHKTPHSYGLGHMKHWYLRTYLDGELSTTDQKASAFTSSKWNAMVIVSTS